MQRVRCSPRNEIPAAQINLFLRIISLKNTFFCIFGFGFAGFATAQTVVEYVNTNDFPRAPGGQYFYSADASEQAYVESGAAGAFKRTGGGFVAGGATPLCRFYGSVSPGPNSHFYTVDSAECNALKAAQITPKPTAAQQWNYESDGFKATPPVNGQCPADTVAIYRSYNSAFSGGLKNVWDSNHRFASRRADVDYLVNRHKWNDEGIQFCAQAEYAKESIPTASSVAQKCDDDNHKSWLRAFTDERYLWYNEVPRLAPQTFVTPLSFYDDLKSWVRVEGGAAAGAYRDRFHFSQSTEAYLQSSQGISSAGYGMRVVLPSTSVPRRAVVVYVEPLGPAAAAGIVRGMEIQSIDGALLLNGSATVLNAGLSPKAVGEPHTFVFSDPANGQTITTTLLAANVQSSPVHSVKTLATDSGKVGYLLFNAFNYPSEGALAAAFTQLRAENVTDLVLDLRYNGGGLIYVAAELAFMIAGDTKRGQLFTTLQYNDKRPNDTRPFPFDATASGFSGTNTTSGAALPTLNLNRVFIITGTGTASASELMINGLRGADITVHLVGTQTVGKPYGFSPTDNCGTTYSSIEFVSNNAKGEADFVDGFAPTCKVSADDYSKQLGDALEGRLAATLMFRASGQCPANSGQQADGSKSRLTSRDDVVSQDTVFENVESFVGNISAAKRN